MRIASGEVLERAFPLARIEIASRQLLDLTQGEEVFLVGIDPATMDRVHDQKQADEHHVDEGHSRLEEVVVRSGDELSDLVDEEPEPDASPDRRQAHGRTIEERECGDQGRQHEQPAPQDVGEVDQAAAHRRISGQVQGQPNDENGRDGGDEEELEEVGRFEGPDEDPPRRSHLSRRGRRRGHSRGSWPRGSRRSTRGVPPAM